MHIAYTPQGMIKLTDDQRAKIVSQFFKDPNKKLTLQGKTFTAKEVSYDAPGKTPRSEEGTTNQLLLKFQELGLDTSWLK